MLPGNTRKMDKSTILQKSIDFLQKHKGEELSWQPDQLVVTKIQRFVGHRLQLKQFVDVWRVSCDRNRCSV